jgi:hypothetical protein
MRGFDMTGKSMRSQDAGNMNLDFLAGLLIFMFAFLYIFVTIPGIFLPYQSNSVDLGAVVYRVTTPMVEDPGMLSLITSGSTDSVQFPNWEDQDAYLTQWEAQTDESVVLRFGLATDKTHPNVLNSHKINKLKEIIESTDGYVSDTGPGTRYDLVRKGLGLGSLKDTISNTLSYGYSLIIREINETTGQYSPTPVLNISRNYYSDIAESIHRAALIKEDDGYGMMVDSARNQSNDTASANLYVADDMLGQNVTVRLTNVSALDTTVLGDITLAYHFVDFDDGNIQIGLTYCDNSSDVADYSIRKNGQFVLPENLSTETINATDRIDIRINTGVISSEYPPFDPESNVYARYFQILTPSADMIRFPDVDYFNYTASNLEDLYSFNRGLLTLQVWKV